MSSASRSLALLLFLVAASTSAAVAAPWQGEQERDRVPRVPGQAFNTSFAHYAGYITVSEDRGAALFYWFFEAAHDPASKPLVLWLNGGPGCSSIAYGLAEEVGPFHVNADGKGVHMNPYSWNQVTNILFLDSPVGVGYSYSNTSDDVLSNGDDRTAKDSLVFLTKWLERFPQYKGREFYLTGESYAGHYVPQLAQAIKRHHEATGDKSINLKGYMFSCTSEIGEHPGRLLVSSAPARGATVAIGNHKNGTQRTWRAHGCYGTPKGGLWRRRSHIRRLLWHCYYGNGHTITSPKT